MFLSLDWSLFFILLIRNIIRGPPKYLTPMSLTHLISTLTYKQFEVKLINSLTDVNLLKIENFQIYEILNRQSLLTFHENCTYPWGCSKNCSIIILNRLRTEPKLFNYVNFHLYFPEAAGRLEFIAILCTSLNYGISNFVFGIKLAFLFLINAVGCYYEKRLYYWQISYRNYFLDFSSQITCLRET